MPADLFREEVRLAQRGEWLGSIRLQAPRPGWIFFAFGLLAIVAILALLLCGHYTRHEQVAGTLVPTSGLLTLTPIAPGIVTHVLVHEGDKVRAGEPLLEISGAQDSASMGNTQAAIAAQLQIKRGRLQADLTGQSHLEGLQHQDLRSRLRLLRGQIAQTKQQAALQQQRVDSSMTLYDQWVKVAKIGVVSKLQLMQQHDTALQNLVQLKSLNGQSFKLRQQAEQLQAQLDQLPAIAAVKRHDTQRQLADVMQSTVQNAAQSAVVLRASAEGTVANVLAHPGQAVIAQQTLLTVLPANATLLAELWVPTSAVGFIHPGEPVMIRFRAFPYQKFGQYPGHVSEVSRSAISSSEVSRLLGQDIKEPRYRVEVALDNQSVLAYGQKATLRPGMTLDADVLLDRRRLIEWVLEPLYGMARGMHGAASVLGGAH